MALNVIVATSVAIQPGTETVQVTSYTPGMANVMVAVGSDVFEIVSAEGPVHVPSPIADMVILVEQEETSGPASLEQFITIPEQMQSVPQVSLPVLALPSSQGEPGSAVPPAMFKQSLSVPVQRQPALQVSLPVLALPSSQGVPVKEVPPTTPSQSIG